MADKRGKGDPPLIPNPTRQAEKRINGIIRFTRRQRRERKWINIHEIAEWYAERSGRFDVAEQDRAYDMLRRDLFFGDFDEDGRPRVRYLNPNLPEETWMTRAFLHRIMRECTDEEIVHLHLSWCWIRRDLFDRWLAKHELPPSPARFLPAEPESSATSPATPRKQANRRRGPKPGTVARYDEADRALFPAMDKLIP